jgi:hypothetical protein
VGSGIHREFDEEKIMIGPRIALLALVAAVSFQSQSVVAESATNGRHDGAHDFDFDLGLWKTHSARLLHPLTGSNDWIEMDGTTDVKPIWGGRANIAEFSADGPKGHLELIALRVYNPTTQQWSLNFATPTVGKLGDVPGVGEFRNGRADFYDQEPYNGKSILLRFSIWGITQDTAQSEQAFSLDGGKTWEVNWINKYTRVATKERKNGTDAKAQ